MHLFEQNNTKTIFKKRKKQPHSLSIWIFTLFNLKHIKTNLHISIKDYRCEDNKLFYRHTIILD